MKTLDFKGVLITIKEYLWMTIGMFLFAFGWIGCIVPAQGVGGGATGLSVILSHAIEQFVGFELQIGTLVLIINCMLLLIAGFLIGWKFGVKTIYCIIMISVAMNTWQLVLGPDSPLPSVRDLFADLNHLEAVLRVILGGLIAGLGVAISFRQGGSTGGIDIVAMIINKYRTVSYGRVVIYSDFVIIASALFVGFNIDAVIYGYVMTAVFSYTVDALMSGSKQSSQVFIVTHDYEKMADAIATEVHRGVTLIESTGWYSKDKSKIVMVVCRKRETEQVLKFVKKIDPDAFITVGSVMGVYGKGFQALNKI